MILFTEYRIPKISWLRFLDFYRLKNRHIVFGSFLGYGVDGQKVAGNGDGVVANQSLKKF